MTDKMPGEVWVKQHDIGEGWKQNRVYFKNKIGVPYRLKSSEDKTIRELAAALEKAYEVLEGCNRDYTREDIILKALTTHAPRIAEAQEDKDD